MKTSARIIVLFFASFLCAHAGAQVAPPPADTSAQAGVHSANAPDTARNAYAEVMPQFPGGQSAFMLYLQQNIRYPADERKHHREGVVYVSFVVEKDGSITNVRCVKGVNGAPGLSDEAVRVISAMPAWSPGSTNGKPVRVEVTQPVRFALH
ncbi:MAG TPA: energy transducer TonB [Bacteroidia bacterium]|nr:energy transducer TonB [Bacteroidia bacterium]